MIKGGRLNRVSIYTGIKYEPIKQENLIPTVDALRKGDEEAYQRMIEGHIGIAASIAADYATVTSYDPDECMGVALCALCTAVERIKRGLCEHTNYGAYINKTVNGAIYNSLATDYLVKPPLRSEDYKLMIKEKRAFNVALFVELDPTLEQEEQYDLEELFQSNWFTKREQTILRMKYEGYTDKEVASEVGISFQRVAQLRDKLKPLVIKWIKQNGR